MRERVEQVTQLHEETAAGDEMLVAFIETGAGRYRRELVAPLVERIQDQDQRAKIEQVLGILESDETDAMEPPEVKEVAE